MTITLAAGVAKTITFDRRVKTVKVRTDDANAADVLVGVSGVTNVPAQEDGTPVADTDDVVPAGTTEHYSYRSGIDRVTLESSATATVYVTPVVVD